MCLRCTRNQRHHENSRSVCQPTLWVNQSCMWSLRPLARPVGNQDRPRLAGVWTCASRPWAEQGRRSPPGRSVQWCKSPQIPLRAWATQNKGVGRHAHLELVVRMRCYQPRSSGQYPECLRSPQKERPRTVRRELETALRSFPHVGNVAWHCVWLAHRQHERGHDPAGICSHEDELDKWLPDTVSR